MHEITVRSATRGDWETVADFNCRLAAESENMILDAATVGDGVRALLTDVHKGRYFLAIVEGRTVGQLMHTTEWSDWRNGDIWWLQSVYVLPEYRRQGVFRRLFQHVQRQAETNPEVVGMRLYVEDGNRLAHQTYRELGLRVAGYHVMERLFT